MSDRWSVTVGPHGAKATVEERRRGGNVYLKAYDSELGTYRKRSLGFAVRDEDGDLKDEAVERARAAAAELSNRRLKDDDPLRSTELRDLFRAFRREVLPDLDERYEAELERAMEFWSSFLGPNFRIEDEFGLRQWNAARRRRASGKLDARGNRVRRRSGGRSAPGRSRRP